MVCKLLVLRHEVILSPDSEVYGSLSLFDFAVIIVHIISYLGYAGYLDIFSVQKNAVLLFLIDFLPFNLL